VSCRKQAIAFPMLQASLYALLWVGALRQALPGAQLPCLSSGGSVRACRRPALKPTMGIASPKMMSAPTPAYAAYTSTGPMLSMFELRADGRVTPYQSTLTSMHSTHKLPSRDVRLLRSSTPVLAVRNGFVLFDLGDVKGVLQHDRVVLLGPNGQKVKAIGEEVKQRFNTISRSSNGEEYPFEVRLLASRKIDAPAHAHASLPPLAQGYTPTLTLCSPSRATHWPSSRLMGARPCQLGAAPRLHSPD
jgi:hypothetical protein